MAKINNREKAKEMIEEMLRGYEVKTSKYADDDHYIEMTESEFDAILERILDNCGKDLRNQLARYSYKYNIAWLDDAYGGRICTYAYYYAFVKFI